MSDSRVSDEGPLVELNGVTLARPGGVPVLYQVDLAVRRSEVFAVLGSHASGKTTLLDIVAGLVQPDRGEVRLRLSDASNALSTDPGDRRRHLVYAGSNGLHATLTPVDNVRFFMALAGSPKRLTRLEVENLLRDVGVRDEYLRVPMRRTPRAVPALVHLGLAVLRRTPLVLLDDPTLGLDSADAHQFQASLRFVRDHGITVLASTSDIMLAGGAADRVGILAAGRIAFVRDRTGWFDQSALELYTEYLGDPPSPVRNSRPLLGEVSPQP